MIYQNRWFNNINIIANKEYNDIYNWFYIRYVIYNLYIYIIYNYYFYFFLILFKKMENNRETIINKVVTYIYRNAMVYMKKCLLDRKTFLLRSNVY
jgi:hypothetical protein